MTDGSGDNHVEYDCLNADRLGDDAWIVCGFFYGKISIKAHRSLYQNTGNVERRNTAKAERRFFGCLKQTYRLRRNVKWSIS